MTKLRYLIYGLLIFSLIAIYWQLCQRTYFSDSEIWQIYTAKNFPNWFGEPRFPNIYKPLFQFYLSFTHRLNLSSVETLLFARGQMFVVLISLWISVFLWAQRVLKDFESAIAVLLLCMTSTLFLSRGFRARADIFSALFFYLSMFFLLKGSSFWKLSVPHILMLASTPKAIILLAIKWIYMKTMGQRIEKSEWIKYTAAISIGFSLFVVLYLSVEGNPLLKLFEYAKGSFTGRHQVSYLGWDSFIHLRLFAWRNPISILLIGIALVLGPKKLGSSWLLALVSLGAIIIFPNRRPFFLVIFVPIFSLLIVRLISYWFGARKGILILVVVLVSSIQAMNFIRHINTNDNSSQLKLIGITESYIEENSPLKYYDSMGSIMNFQSIQAFIGPGQDNSFSIAKVKRLSPDLIMYTGKLALEANAFKTLFAEKYIYVGYDVLAKGQTVVQKRLRTLTYANGRSYYAYSMPEMRYHRSLNGTENSRLISVTTLRDLTKMDSSILIGEHGNYRPFLNTQNLANINEKDKILIPSDVDKFYVSAFPQIPQRSGLISGFNKQFVFDVLY